ncbi:thioredoxin family protein [Kangiella spongicola]|uniref:Thioredoxin family protein n=1 Tax=Kangiella spongicola TaxID=796379 RepID=A0A318D7P6_9GAMM|nr:thioredoxin family protein [Kangiella spongicola]PXF63818.1 thioredoxin family protein [Kangiella spongicola]
MTAKLITFATILGTIAACTSPHNDNSESENSRFAQHMDASGPMTIDELQSQYPVFAVKRNSPLNSEALEQLNAVTTPTQITAYLGTWCHDSQREIPRLIQLKKALSNPNIQLQLITLDRQKSDSEGLAKKADVKYTPTIIVYQNQEELGRIVESTSEPIEIELLDIINKN